jgi:hypothetical protein
MTQADKRMSTTDIANATEAVKDEQRRAEAAAASRPAPRDRDEPRASLFPDEEFNGFRSRWTAIQTGFVDQPKEAVSEADALVAQVISRVAEVFSRERTALEQQWDRGDQVSTEDLRVALRRYRAFFDRLLSA